MLLVSFFYRHLKSLTYLLPSRPNEEIPGRYQYRHVPSWWGARTDLPSHLVTRPCSTARLSVHRVQFVNSICRALFSKHVTLEVAFRFQLWHRERINIIRSTQLAKLKLRLTNLCINNICGSHMCRSVVCSSTEISLRRCQSRQESHAVAGKPRDAAVNSDRYQQPVGQKQSEWETENIT